MTKSFLFLFLLISSLSYSQNISKRLSVKSGGNIDFIFDTFFEYNNGITYNNWTTIEVEFSDTTDLGVQDFVLNWKLDVKAWDTDIRGTSNNLPLETIELEVTGDPGPTYSLVPIALSNADQSLVTAGPQIDLAAPIPTVMRITYHCGKSLLAPNNLLGRPADYYGVDIVFTLSEE